MERTDAEHKVHGDVSDVGGATPGKPFCFSYATGTSKLVYDRALQPGELKQLYQGTMD